MNLETIEFLNSLAPYLKTIGEILTWVGITGIVVTSITWLIIKWSTRNKNA